MDVRPFGNLLRWATVATGMGKPANVLHVRVAASRLVPVGRRPVALHFVGFRGDEYSPAVRVFGIPDFIHIDWDRWARQEVMSGDTAIFAKGTFEDAPSPYSYPDLHESQTVGPMMDAGDVSPEARRAATVYVSGENGRWTSNRSDCLTVDVGTGLG